MSIRFRLTLWYSGILAVTLLVFGIGLYFFLNFYIDRENREQVKRSTTDVFSRINYNAGFSFNGPDLKIWLGDRDRNTNMLYQIYNFTNNNVSRSAILNEIDVLLPITDSMKEKAAQQQMFFEEVPFLNDVLLTYNIPLIAANDRGQTQLVGLLQGAVSIGMYKRFFELLTYVLAFLALLSIVLAATYGWFLSRKALQPIEQIITSTEQIEKGADLEKRIPYHGPHDEIGRLTSTINGMLSRLQTAYMELEEAYRAQRRFVSDASHELRTPLTTIRGNVDLLEKMWRNALTGAQIGENTEQQKLSLEAMQDIAGESERMSRLVNDLLALARADAGFRIEMQPVELKSLVEEVVRKAQFLPHTAEWRVGSLQALDGVIVQGNRDFLQQMLNIFIENAFKYTPEGSVQLDTLLGKGQIGIRITDTGIGMDQDEVAHIFDRFYRADLSRGVRSGTGLGLSIAKWIIQEHEGSVEVFSQKNKGSRFVIWMPYSLAIHAEVSYNKES